MKRLSVLTLELLLQQFAAPSAAAPAEHSRRQTDQRAKLREKRRLLATDRLLAAAIVKTEETAVSKTLRHGIDRIAVATQQTGNRGRCDALSGGQDNLGASHEGGIRVVLDDKEQGTVFLRRQREYHGHASWCGVGLSNHSVPKGFSFDIKQPRQLPLGVGSSRKGI
jgi:hypothetical protein